MMVSAASGVNAELLSRSRLFFKDRSVAESELLAEPITQ
jgi:hypothetical protein